MTRLWPDGLPITVVTGSAAQPVSFTWQGQVHPVAEITKTWRVDIDWWRAHIWRAYYKLSTETGLLVVIYQDLLSNKLNQNSAWYLQRLYD